MVQIVTERLTLRSAREDDLAPLHTILSDPRAMTWWSTPPHASLDQTSTWLASMIGMGPDNPDFIIERDGQVIGKAGFFALPWVGYILHPDHWGQGLAREAVSAAIDHVFAGDDHDSLQGDVDPENAASIRLLEGLGFVRTGFEARTYNVGGVWKDSYFYSLSRNDWMTRGRG